MELSQLLFLVGHCAIQQIAHLEAIENKWKKMKHEQGIFFLFFCFLLFSFVFFCLFFFFYSTTVIQISHCVIEIKNAPTAKANKQAKSTKSKSKEKEEKEEKDDELEQCAAGTVEDELAESIQYVRERELLFSEKSLLSSFVPLVSYVCASTKTFDVRQQKQKKKRKKKEKKKRNKTNTSFLFFVFVFIFVIFFFLIVKFNRREHWIPVQQTSRQLPFSQKKRNDGSFSLDFERYD